MLMAAEPYNVNANGQGRRYVARASRCRHLGDERVTPKSIGSGGSIATRWRKGCISASPLISLARGVKFQLERRREKARAEPYGTVIAVMRCKGEIVSLRG